MAMNNNIPNKRDKKFNKAVEAALSGISGIEKCANYRAGYGSLSIGDSFDFSLVEKIIEKDFTIGNEKGKYAIICFSNGQKLTLSKLRKFTPVDSSVDCPLLDLIKQYNLNTVEETLGLLKAYGITLKYEEDVTAYGFAENFDTPNWTVIFPSGGG